MATINDIAKMAGVSAATVSHVVNKTRFVSPELAKRVEDAINALEYPPNFVVKKSKSTLPISTNTKYIILLASDLKDPFQADIEANLEALATAADCRLVSASYGEDSVKLDLISQLLLSCENALGIIAFPGNSSKALEKILSTARIPVVLIGKEPESLQCDAILSDDFGGAYKATNHLIKSGHEYIAMVCWDALSASTNNRIEGYKKALSDNHIFANPEYIISDTTNEAQVIQSLRRLSLAANPPTAVFAANYKSVLSILKYIDANTIDCPKDLSLIGFDDFEWAELHIPSITTVARDSHQIAESAYRFLNERISENEGEAEPSGKPQFAVAPRMPVIPTELRIRNSTSGIGRGPFGEKAASADALALSESDRKLIHAGKYTAAISFHYTGKAWMQLHEQGIKDEFNTLGISLLAVTDAHFDPKMQSKQLNSLLSLEPDVIISIPTDSTETSDAYKRIAESNTKLILITNIPDSLTPDDYVTCISVNEHSHGRCVGRGLGDYMTKHNLHKIGFIKHGANFYATNQRDNAAEQILVEEFPDLEIVGCSTFQNEDEAYQRTIELITLHPEIEGIYVSWEGPATQVITALSEIGRTDIAIATADLEYSLALNMAKGGMVKAISAQRPYEQGRAMALAAANALIGKKVPPFIGLEPIFTKQDNLLKVWEKVYKEAPPLQLLDILKNPNLLPAQGI